MESADKNIRVETGGSETVSIWLTLRERDILLVMIRNGNIPGQLLDDIVTLRDKLELRDALTPTNHTTVR